MRLSHPKPVLSHSSNADTAKIPFASRITRGIYFLALIGLALYIIWYGVFRFFYIDNRGLVNVDRIRIASSRGGRILKLPVKTGDHVKKGALLARLKSLDECTSLTLSGLQPETPELRSLRLKQLADRARLPEIVRQRREKKARLDRMNFRHAIELNINGYTAQRQKLEDEVLVLAGEARSLRRIIPLRKKEITNLKVRLKLGLNQRGCSDEFIHAPYAGIIVSQDHWQFEVMQRTEPMMDMIADKAKVHIESYFRNDAFNMIAVGKKLTVYFPDGRESKAQITEIKSTALPFPEREFMHYLPTRTRLLAILEPVNDADMPLWKQFNQVELEVQGWR